MKIGNIVKFVVMVLAGYAIGCLFASMMTEMNPEMPIPSHYMGIMFTGVPFGWKFYNDHIGWNLYGFHWLVLFFWALKLAFSIAVGWIIMVVEFIMIVVSLIRAFISAGGLEVMGCALAKAAGHIHRK